MRGAKIVGMAMFPAGRASGCRAMTFLSSTPPTYLADVEVEAPTCSWSARLADDHQPIRDRVTFASPARVSDLARCGSPQGRPSGARLCSAGKSSMVDRVGFAVGCLTDQEGHSRLGCFTAHR
jgi:hypothetical protein